jgi:hypothetical protein
VGRRPAEREEGISMDHQRQGQRGATPREREGWGELLPFALFGLTIVSAVVAIALT